MNQTLQVRLQFEAGACRLHPLLSLFYVYLQGLNGGPDAGRPSNRLNSPYPQGDSNTVLLALLVVEFGLRQSTYFYSQLRGTLKLLDLVGL